MTSKEKLAYAQSLYLNTDHTQQEIAERVGVSENTLTAWKVKHNWDTLRGATTATKPKMIASFYQQITLIEKSAVDAEGQPRALTLKETQAIRMITKAIQEMDKKLAADHYVTMMEEFTKFLFTNDKAAGKLFLPWLDRFMDQKFSELT